MARGERFAAAHLRMGDDGEVACDFPAPVLAAV
jgi:hypothetical protein